MKKSNLIFSLIFIFASISFISAQEISQNAIGLRLGDGNGFGTEVSYQRALGDNNRLELDLGIRSDDNFDGFNLTGIYQWVWNIDGGFNWYAGAGAGIANYNYDIPGVDDDSETFIYAAGQVGIEYNFDIPLMLSLDTRPTLGFGDRNDDLDFDIALGIRYQF